jgi:hypothetical protein
VQRRYTGHFPPKQLDRKAQCSLASRQTAATFGEKVEMAGVLVCNCPHCSAQHSSFTLVWCAPVPGQQDLWVVTGVCGACSYPISFPALNKHGSSAPPTTVNGNIDGHFSVQETWPSRPEPAAPPHTPKPVARRFLEGEDAFARRNWNSAVAMYRSALDIATKGMEGAPANATFFKRLEWLHENHKITPDIRSWADHVRVEGNAALHDPEEFGEGDAKALRFFIEMFLRYIFEMPGAVEEFRGKTAT